MLFIYNILNNMYKTYEKHIIYLKLGRHQDTPLALLLKTEFITELLDYLLPLGCC